MEKLIAKSIAEQQQKTQPQITSSNNRKQQPLSDKVIQQQQVYPSQIKGSQHNAITHQMSRSIRNLTFQAQKQPSGQSLYDKKQLSNSNRTRTQNFISQFLDYEIYKQKNLNPQFLRIKNNILLIILILSSFGIYYLFQNFVDVMLLAFISGVGYQQMRERFIKFWQSDEPFFQKEMSLLKRISSILAYMVLILFLPWIRIQFGYPEDFGKHFALSDLLYTFSFKANLVVLCFQLFLLLKVLHLIFAPFLFPIIAQHAPKSMTFYKWTFGIVFTVISLGAIFIIPSALAMQVSHGGYRIQKKVQQHLKCRLINYNSYSNSSALPLCSQIFLKNNTFFQQTLKEFKAQTSQVEDCMTHLSEMQKRLIGYEFFQYKELTCTAYLIVVKASTYITPDTDVLATGTTFLKTIFGNIALIIMSFSNIIFSVTSFATIFYITVTYFNPRSTVMQEIFFGERKELLSQITNLIQATLFIVVQHFFLSIVLLELFNFSNFNMLISTFLSLMAFVPFFRPWFGALFFCLIHSLFSGNHLINLVFVVVYYYSSQRIFSFRFKQMQFHELITNMSILFGIYQFGIAGIFYGPMIMILFRSVHRELLRNQVYLTQDDNKNDQMQSGITVGNNIK